MIQSIIRFIQVFIETGGCAESEKYIIKKIVWQIRIGLVQKD